jgi:hypothetical protein
MRVLKVLWAAVPGTLIGLLLAPFFEERRVEHGVLLCEGASWPRRLGWRYTAITFGHVILAVKRLEEPLLNHELVHVRQYEAWGPAYIPAYLLASAWARLRGGHSHDDNPFEVDARRRSGAG